MQIYNFKFPDRQAKIYYLETEQVFPVNFAKTFENFFFTEHLRATFSFQNWESSEYSRHHYLEYPLSRTFTMLIFLFGPLNILMNFLLNPFVISNSTISNFHYMKQFSRSPQSFFGCFPSHPVFGWMIMFISGIWMLITALTKTLFGSYI